MRVIVKDFETGKGRSPAALDRRKWVAFMVALWLIPVLFFLAVEGILRLAGYGSDYPLFQPVTGYPDYLYPNEQVARRYFSSGQSIPSIPFDSFRASKDSNSVRIFVQGGSSAAGYPYYFGGGFADMLEQRLLQTFPGRNVEVVNTAMAAVNSYTLLDLTDEIIARQPDAVLIYAGHNEYYGALGAASSESFGQWRSVVRLFIKLQNVRTVQLLREALAKIAGLIRGKTPGEHPGATLMARMIGDRSVPLGSSTYRRGLSQFEANLEALLERYREHDIPVFVGTVVSNIRDQPPFLSGLTEETDVEKWNVSFDSAKQRATAGDTTGALSLFDELILLDDRSAIAHYEKARLLDASGEAAAAKSAYLSAKERDELRFRAPEAVNLIIETAAGQWGAVVIDIEDAFERASPDGIVGASLVTDHLHPNVDGYFEIANAFYDGLRTAGIGGRWTAPVAREVARRDLLFTELDSLVGEYRLQLLRSSWPFQPLEAPVKPVTIERSTPLEEIAYGVFRGEIRRVEGLSRLRDYYLEQGNLTGALQTSMATIQRYPFLSRPYLAAADVLLRLGRSTDALGYYLASDDREEIAVTQRMIGSILLQQGHRERAIPYLQRSIELEPGNIQALYNLSGAYALTGEYEKARATIARLLEIEPGHADTRRLLESLPG